MSYNNNLAKQFYDVAPYFIKILISSIYGISQRSNRYGKTYKSQIDILKDSQYWTNEELANYQQDKTTAFLLNVCKNVPYYKNAGYGNLFTSASDYQSLPILVKEQVKQNIQELYNIGSDKMIWSHTSGTTGSAMIFPISMEAFQNEYAHRWLHYGMGGVSLHKREKIAFCAGHPVAASGRRRPPFWVHDLVNNHMYFSSYHMSEGNLRYYIKKLEDFNPLLLHGYPSSIYLLANAYKSFGKKKLALKSIFTSSETLLHYQRKKIEDTFQVKVYNYYGTSEMSAYITECEKGELHLKSEYSYVEILNSDNQACKPGETGRIVSTNFTNTAFPLIRYDVGDAVKISSNQAPKCGKNGLLIDHIWGRIENYIYTPEGYMVGRLDHLFKDALNVKEAQIEQRDVTEVIIRITPGDNYTKDNERTILKEARKRLGNSIKILFEYVEYIPRTSGGKFRFIISNLNTTFTHHRNSDFQPDF